MTILHKGFDTIALSIKAALTPEFQSYLDGEQTREKAENASVLCEYGGVAFHLKHHGGSGYQFLLDGGPDGASWAFKRPHPKDPWGIRINIGSRFLALNGGASGFRPRTSASPVSISASMYWHQSSP